jgi:hypothetical protein
VFSVAISEQFRAVSLRAVTMEPQAVNELQRVAEENPNSDLAKFMARGMRYSGYDMP